MITERFKARSEGTYRGWLSGSIGQLKLQDRTLLQDIAALPGLVATLNYDHLLVEETGRPAITWQETNAVLELARGWRDDPDTLAMIKERAQSDENEDVRQSAVRELARGWRDEPDTLAILKQRAQSDENKNVRQSAVRELARGWKDEPEIQVFLEGL
jgi:hypothetical protein